MLPQLLPTLRPAGDNRLSYSRRPHVHLALVLLGLGFAALGTYGSGLAILGKAAWYIVAAILVVSGLSVDGWTFFAPGPEVCAPCVEALDVADRPAAAGDLATDRAFAGLRRRFGLLPFTRSWSLPVSRLSSVGLRSGRAGESPNSLQSDRDRLEASIFGMGRGAWVALSLVLDDGRSLVIISTKPGKAAALRRDGAAIAAHLGLPFVDGTSVPRGQGEG